MQGGYKEYYGKYLIKINFVEDAVIYLRNTKKYVRIDAIRSVPSSMKRESYTEIVYQSYLSENYPNMSYHELMIRDPKVISSWSLNDPLLINQFHSEYKKLLTNELERNEYHFFCNQNTMRKEYLSYAKSVKAELERFWSNQQNSDLTFDNKKQRRPIQTD